MVFSWCDAPYFIADLPHRIKESFRVSLEPQSIFEDFLSALGNPAAGVRLYQMHAPDAIVRCGESVGRAEEADCNAFATAHREIGLQWADALPRFAQPTLLRQSDDANKDATVAWFEITETRDRRKLVAALGIKTQDGLPRIGWATLASRLHNWSYAEGYLQCLADYPWMRVSEPARARALIDASYFRQHWRSPVKFSSLPDARFSCQMSAVCCKHDFEITLPAEAQLLIDAMPWQTVRPELQGTQLPRRLDGKLQLKTNDETCRFLGSRGQCLIHQTLGRQPFGPCCVFPVAFAQTPEGVAVALSPICDSTRHGVGPALVDREDDLRERLVHAEPRRPDGLRLLPGMQITWEQFRDVEKGLCDILAAADLPLRRRLYLGSRFLSALRDNEAVEVERWVGEPMVSITAELRQAIHDMLVRVLAWDRAVLQSLPKAIPPALFETDAREPEVLARLLQNTLFCKAYSYAFDLTTAYNFLIVLYLLALLMQEASEHLLTERMWRELGSLGVHGLLKKVLHEGVPDGFRQVFGTAEFGMWMLSA
jgi:hypothetical protein